MIAVIILEGFKSARVLGDLLKNLVTNNIQ